MTRSLHPLHLRLLELQRAAIPDAEPAPASAAEIAAAQELLGRPLPPGYKRFLEVRMSQASRRASRIGSRSR